MKLVEKKCTTNFLKFSETTLALTMIEIIDIHGLLSISPEKIRKPEAC